MYFSRKRLLPNYTQEGEMDESVGARTNNHGSRPYTDNFLDFKTRHTCKFFHHLQQTWYPMRVSKKSTLWRWRNKKQYHIQGQLICLCMHKKIIWYGKGFINFSGYKHNITGTLKPTLKILKKLWIGNSNKALANTIEMYNITNIKGEGTLSFSLLDFVPSKWQEESKFQKARLIHMKIGWNKGSPRLSPNRLLLIWSNSMRNLHKTSQLTSPTINETTSLLF